MTMVIFKEDEDPSNTLRDIGVIIEGLKLLPIFDNAEKVEHVLLF